MDLLECRNKLDVIDKQIVKLFEERMDICGKVAETKIASGKAVYDAEREKQKLDAVSAMADSEFNQVAVRELFSQMMSISRKYQYSILAEHGRALKLGFERLDKLPMDGVRVVHQGVEGAYSHAAALQYFGENASIYHVAHFEDAMKEVQLGNADYAVMPIENSSAGAVIDMYDLLTRYDNYIVAETFLPVEHALLSVPGAKLSDIKTVFSHPQALMQCSQFLNDNGFKQISVENTAVAAKRVVEEGDKTQAAVASEIAGKLYGLELLKPAIQNNQGNTTRFIILANRKVYQKNAGKISLCFELPHTSGSLYNMLGNFIFNHVNMMMIESRPIPGRNWEYRFFVDIEGNLQDAGVKNALRGIGAEALNFKILGNY
ncbi:bifunctional chorismate mutase/prephenate dehydratase [Clostridium sp. AM42-4]|uniref:bifunctional chorismate mutase/prephenate dehydratase n=1 Tax=Clostridium sp. AM42-4 TaxID=2292305 RepID=UPI000E4B0AEC|nr:bifunctional chorismate mutase/prephenate dehydratase [Clostridium sp. AM42-4]RHS90483.1 bifunctional chorismate mutase/prephenate dehydratase [Clostridium sp. AM42-4]